MKIFLCSILCIVLSFTLQAQDSEVLVFGQVTQDSVNSEMPHEIFVLMDYGLELVFSTNEDGTFAFDVPMTFDDSLTCGTAFIINCFGNYNEQKFCLTPDTDSLYLEFIYCDQSNFCQSRIDYTIEDNGTVIVFATHPEVGTWTYEWSNGDTTSYTLADVGEEICLTTTQSLEGEECVYSSCVTISDFPDCEVIIYESNGYLFGFDEGVTLHAEGQGGEVEYYEWSTGDSTQAIIVSQPGVYCLDVVFVDGCKAKVCYEVFDVFPFDSCVAYIQPIYDQIGNVNQLEAFAFSDMTPAILWSTGDTTTIITPDSSGNYCVEITYAECSISACYDYLAPGDCTLDIWSDPLGFEAGLYADFKTNRGGEVTYQWSNGAIDPWIFVYSPGEYCVTVTNVDGCEKVACQTVEPDTNLYEYCWVNLREHNNENGKGIIAESFNPNLQYIWSNGEIGAIIYPESSGEYCVTATDQNGCKTSDCIYFYVEGDCAIDVVEEYYGGRLYLYPIGYGKGPISFTWDNGIDSFSYYFPVDTAGEYCVTMTDADGCTATWCGFIEPYNGNYCEAYIYEEWNGDEESVYRVQAFGATPFSYLWEDGSTGDSIILNKPGRYCVTVTDDAGCEISTCVEVYEKEECYVYLDYSVGIVSDTIVTAYSYGTPPFVYEWSSGENTESILFPDSLACVTVTDANGCVSEACTQFIDSYPCEAVVELDINEEGDSLLSVYTFGEEIIDYLWDNGDSTRQTPYTGENNCVTVYFASGCQTVVCYSDAPQAFEGLAGFTVRTLDSVRGIDIEAQIDVFAILDNGEVEETEAEIVYLGGTAIVFVKDANEYLVRASADGYLPTYYRSTLFWEEATSIGAGINLDAVLFDLSMIPDTDLEGNGLIGGSVSTGNESLRLGNNRSIDPIAGATILITHLDGTPVTYQYTNSNGKFSIGDLPLGSYMVIMEMPGQERIVKVVHLKSGHEFEQNIQFTIDIGQDNTTSIKSVLNEDIINIYPNPAKDFIQLQFSERLDNVTVAIFNLSGQLMLYHELQNPEIEKIEIDKLTATGMYQLILTADQGSIAQKFVKLDK